MIEKVENYYIFSRGKEKDGRYKNKNGSKWNQSDSNKKLWDVKEYHVYKTLWNPLIGEFSSWEREPDNPMDKYPVCVKKENKIVGHLPLGQNNILFS